MRLPVLRELTPLGRVVLLVTLAVSALALAMAYLAHIEGTPLFVVSALAILGLAYVVGLATERLGDLTGPQIGGVLNATFGNIAELIIAFFALQAGLIDVVKASITGSIIGNLLLVLGASLLIGGLRHGTQRFSARIAGLDATMLVLAVIGLFIPATFAISSGQGAGAPGRSTENEGVAVVLIVLYVLMLSYRIKHPVELPGGREPTAEAGPSWTPRAALVVLLGSAALLAVLSELLVGAIDPFIAQFDLTPLFVGVIILPIIGNLAEQSVAVKLAAKDHLDFSMAVAMGSSLQIALFVAPVLVLLGLVIGQPMDLVFTPLEIAAVAVAAGISALIALDGESNWLEGALLLGVYAILAISFFELT
ncbi:MAG: calcium/proton exchanger [Candidatus Limnocylindrales bacterium]